LFFARSRLPTCRRQKNKFSRYPQRPAGEPKTGSGWIFLCCHQGTTGNIKKDKGAATEEEEGAKKA